MYEAHDKRRCPNRRCSDLSIGMNIEITNKRTRDVFIRVDVHFTGEGYDETRTFDGFNWEDIKAKIEDHLNFLASTEAELARIPEGELLVTYEDDKAVVLETADTAELMVVDTVV